MTSSYFTYEDTRAYSQTGLVEYDSVRSGAKDSELEGCLVRPYSALDAGKVWA